MKILILGDAGVGKTNYINSIVGKQFVREYIPTEVVYPTEFNGNIYYDFPGQCVFDKRKIEGIDQCWILFRSDSRMSLVNVLKWEQKAKEMCGKKIKIKFLKNVIYQNGQKPSDFLVYDIKKNCVNHL
tara:strand:- start:1231 stop:1614 length:384 start_codon:yes stop_codon:yes gene_type:complete